MYPFPWFGIFGSNFLKLSQCPTDTKTGLTPGWSLQLSKASLDLKCGVETFGSLSMYPSPWFKVLGPDFFDYPNHPKYSKIGIIWKQDGLYTWQKPPLMWKVELNTLNQFLCIPPHDLGYMVIIFPNFPNPLNTLKKHNLTLGSLKLWVTFCEPAPIIFGISAQFHQFAQMSQKS